MPKFRAWKDVCRHPVPATKLSGIASRKWRTIVITNVGSRGTKPFWLAIAIFVAALPLTAQQPRVQAEQTTNQHFLIEVKLVASSKEPELEILLTATGPQP